MTDVSTTRRSASPLPRRDHTRSIHAGDAAGRAGEDRGAARGRAADLLRPGASASSPARAAEGPARPQPDAADLVEQASALLAGHPAARLFGSEVRFACTPEGLEAVVPSRFLADVLERRVAAELRALLGEGRSLSVRVEAEPEPARAAAPRQVPMAEPARSAPQEAPRPRRDPEQLRHRLEDFIVGAANRVAYGAAVRLADDIDARSFSPLFIHGPCGLGKTHLLQGIANRFRERRPDAAPGKVRYITAEAFTNKFVQAVRKGDTSAFHRTFRGVELLCIDDVHFLANKEGTQTELLHTFDALDLDGARIVLASDAHPRDIRRLSQALVSRFVSGAVVELQSPDEELCLRLVRARAEQRGMPIEEPAVRLIVERARGNDRVSVRDFEGLLTQVEAVWRLMPDLAGPGGVVGPTLVAQALGARLKPETERGPGSRPARLESIVEQVCEALAVEHAELLGRGRHPRVVLARAVIVRLARLTTNRSFPEIARAMARQNHSTVVTADQRIRRQIEAGESVGVGSRFDGLPLAELVEQLRRQLR